MLLDMEGVRLLAYETGVHLGDGSLYRDGVTYAGDSREDFAFYSELLPSVLEKLYSKKPRVRVLASENTVLTYLKSRSVVRFKADLGLPIGSKSRLTHFPENLVEECPADLLRGLADTDFCVYFRDYDQDGFNEYPRIEGNFSNPAFVSEIASMLGRLGIGFNTWSCTTHDGRFKEYRIRIEGRPRVTRWVEKIGFSNPKHRTKITLWKRFGFCQPRVSYQERLKLLDE